MRYFTRITILTVILAGAIFLASGVSFAAEKVFIKEYTYQASEIDSKVTSRAQALEQVKRLLLEELGTYLMSETEVKDFKLTKDKITVLTAGIVQAEILDEKWDGERYYLKARIKADPDEVAASLDRLRKDSQKTRELEDAKKKTEEALKEIERLKFELEAVKGSTDKQRAYALTVDRLIAVGWFEKGYALHRVKDYEGAIDAYTKAIELAPDYVNAYVLRGMAYDDGKFLPDRAIEDLNKAISLKPDYAYAYNNRGNAYNNKGQYDRAIEDLNKAISLNAKTFIDPLDPNDSYFHAEAYNNRGLAYNNKGLYDRAIKDLDKAISLKPDLAEAYTNRGVAYGRKGLYDRAIEDFDKAISLKPDDALTYYGRGLSYVSKGLYDRAIKDLDKAISLKLDDAYNGRGLAYEKKGFHSEALRDYQKSCELGNDIGCDNARKISGR